MTVAVNERLGSTKADSHIACRGAEGLECVFPIQCGRVWFTLAMPRPCHALTMPFFSRSRHSTAVERRPVGYLPAFVFFRLPRGVPRSLLSEAYHSTSQRSIRTTVKSDSSTLQKRLAVRVFPATTRTFAKDTALSEQGRGAAWHVWINARHGRGTAWARHAMCASAFKLPHRHQSDPQTYVSKKPTASVFRDVKDLVTLQMKAVGTFETSGSN
jgi:hypothetical protein